ncbi:hypothetical protein Q8A67_004722 [Cirrhinus molitorella]|uniref:Uncharacterized protein n=1 Tax=Cirrhinus molitorella TaxID=172907 RepID=A0AA88Q0X4_9TELE|nr:hypothetical protein Q8A67_004722 [Cirrhinus molitorella]
MHDGSYPTITIFKDIPYSRGEEGDFGNATLNPNAQPFQPFGGEENIDVEYEYVQADGGNVEEVVPLAEQEGAHSHESPLEPENPLENVGNSPVKELQAIEGNSDEATEELISHSTELVEGKGDEMRKEGNEILTEENVEINEDIPLQEEQETELRRFAVRTD